MDQIYQLQKQIQDLQREVNNINQVASQLQRSEASHAAQLQQMSQNESNATQQLQTLQQLCSRIGQEVSNINSMAQQIPQMMTMSSGFSNYNPTPVAHQYASPSYGNSGGQFSGGSTNQFAQNQQVSQMAANRYGMGLSSNEFASNQQISNMANQGMLGGQSTMGVNAYGAGFSSNSAGNYTTTPAHPISRQASSQYGTSGFASSQYVPTTGYSNPSSIGMSNQNIGQYSNF